MTTRLALPASSDRAMNWEEPANTIRDMPRAPPAESPLGAARVPKIRPKGAAPNIMGTVSRTPRQHSRVRLGWEVVRHAECFHGSQGAAESPLLS